VALFADHEFADGRAEDSQLTRVGARSQPWLGAELASSVNLGMGPGGSTVGTAVGLTQNLRVNEQLSFSAGVDRAATVRAPGETPLRPDVPSSQGTGALLPATALRPAEDYTSVFGGLAWNDGPWGATLRLENRAGESVDRRNLAATVHRDLAAGEALATSLLYSDSETRGSGTQSSDQRIDLRLSYAWRPLASRWIVLNRLDLIDEEQRSSTSSIDTQKLVNNFNANWHPGWRTQLSLQHGIKLVRDRFDGVSQTGITDLLGAEWRRDLGRRFDLGLRGAMLRSWKTDTRRFSYGASFGVWPVDNLWLGLGYNFEGFRDSDFDGAGHTAKGFQLFFRFKFDQGSADLAAKRRLMFDEAAR
jgi:hypothetical protein